MQIKKASDSSRSGSRNISTLSKGSLKKMKVAKTEVAPSTDEEESLNSCVHGSVLSNEFHDDLLNVVRHMRKTISGLKKLKMGSGGYSTKQVLGATNRQMTMNLKLKQSNKS